LQGVKVEQLVHIDKTFGVKSSTKQLSVLGPHKSISIHFCPLPRWAFNRRLSVLILKNVLIEVASSALQIVSGLMGNLVERPIPVNDLLKQRKPVTGSSGFSMLQQPTVS